MYFAPSEYGFIMGGQEIINSVQVFTTVLVIDFYQQMLLVSYFQSTY